MCSLYYIFSFLEENLGWRSGLDLGCTLESLRELLIILIPRPHLRPFKPESLALGWVQCAAMVENHWQCYQDRRSWYLPQGRSSGQESIRIHRCSQSFRKVSAGWEQPQECRVTEQARKGRGWRTLSSAGAKVAYGRQLHSCFRPEDIYFGQITRVVPENSYFTKYFSNAFY